MGEAQLQQLIAGCLKQDRKDQKMLYKTFYGYAMSICLRYAGNRYEASEILNHGFFKVFSNLNKYSTDKPFKAWIGRIMMNASIDYYRSNIRMANADDLEKAENLVHEDLPDKKLRYDDLLAMIQQLPNAYRTVFNLYAIEGYTHEEIAVMLGISTGTSKSNLFKARDKLKRMIIDAEDVSRDAGGGAYSAIVAINPVNLNVTFFNNGLFR
ncbi:sigma-70 family RNA polymerase sigma factor [Pararcticibacter amylolyticus]|uniref:Sigma-70 family RNA polymerase sigma factor n=2 Tax=Pararcticibacter amylolyticus TaxID=2173175 RepID=A0A2U2PET3_9SPHI|nr:sigma-70 family RNA polymerase sigma factor [Pararcticibacter amylolyticus]